MNLISAPICFSGISSLATVVSVGAFSSCKSVTELVLLFLNDQVLFYPVKLQVLVVQYHHIDHGVVGYATRTQNQIILDI